MSISSSLATALSGLNVSARAADIVSSNVANAMTEGYGARRLDIGSRLGGDVGAGARILAVLRDSDPVLTGQRRAAEAALGHARQEAAHARRIEDLIGLPDAAGSLAARLFDFEARLVAAADAPHNDVALGAAVEAAAALAAKFRDVSDGIQDERMRADAEIARAVGTVNDSLAGLAELNDRIRAVPAGSGDVASLLDAQARLVDRIAPLVPLQTRRDASGALQIWSEGGEMLLGRTAAELEFSATPAIEPSMIFGNSILSGIRADGRDLSVTGGAAQLGGGKLAALFATRDDWAVAAQADLDAVARDLAERFDTTGIDPTVPPGGPGLFTDAGGRSDPAAEEGLSARITVNAAVLADAGGAAWRLRDGIGAPTPGAAGDATLILAQIDTLADGRITASGRFSASERSMAQLLSEHLSAAGRARQGAETREVSSGAVHGALRRQEQARAVDTDAELRNLLRIEQMYAANARVVATAEAMLDELMEIAR